jgi:hypothetical protein
MQPPTTEQDFPITVRASQHLASQSKQVEPVLGNIEAWINFQALGALWYEDESKVPEFDFIVVAKADFAASTADFTEPGWIIEHDNAVAILQDSQFHTKAVIGVGRSGFADSVKMQLVAVANRVVKAYGLQGISG